MCSTSDRNWTVALEKWSRRMFQNIYFSVRKQVLVGLLRCGFYFSVLFGRMSFLIIRTHLEKSNQHK